MNSIVTSSDQPITNEPISKLSALKDIGNKPVPDVTSTLRNTQLVHQDLEAGNTSDEGITL